MRQLIQEAVDARSEMLKLKIALKQLEGEKVKVEVKDAEVMTEATDSIICSPELLSPLPLPQSSSSSSPPPQISSSFPPSPQVPLSHCRL